VKELLKEKKNFALFILALMALFLLYASMPFVAGISGAAILYVLLKSTYLKILKKTKNKTVSAFIAILLSIVLIILPLSYLVYFSLQEFVYLLNDIEKIENAVSPIAATFGYDSSRMMDFVADHIDDIAGVATIITLAVIADIVSITLNAVIMYLILYFALTENKKASALIKRLIPFNDKNSSKLMSEFTHAINVTFIGNGAASIVLGILLAIGLYLLGLGNIFFWVLIGTIMAFIPIIGIQIIWIPAGAYLLLNGNYTGGAAIIIWGAFLSYIFDGFIRQKVQSKVGEMHPLVSLIGLIIGITYFGVVGIIVGPLILTLFVLIAAMFREEYVEQW